MARKRKFSTSNLSFLDIMSCGFGAVALIFLILKHDIDNRQDITPNDLQAEANLLNDDIRTAEALKVRAKNTLSELDQELLKAQGLARRINDDILAARTRLDQLSENDDVTVEQLKLEIQTLQAQKKALEEDQKQGDDLRSISGQGDRQYLTGLKLSGQRILILLDVSGSMLDESLINIIRRRNMPEAQQRQAAKWQRTLATVEWLLAKFPAQSQYQLYTFNTEVKASIPGTKGKWLDVSNKDQYQQAMTSLRSLTPAKGTSLEKAFISMSGFEQRPDNVFLITDGLPTQGVRPPRGNTIDGNARLKLFNQALQRLPRGIPVNVILEPMEGDPMAAAALWQLAQRSKGAFMSPSKDWP